MKHGKLVTSILVLSLAAVTAAFASMAEARSLEQIKASGELLVGSTGEADELPQQRNREIRRL